MTVPQNSLTEWQAVWYLNGGILVMCGILFLLLGDASLQPWGLGPHESHDDTNMPTGVDQVQGEISATVDSVVNFGKQSAHQSKVGSKSNSNAVSRSSTTATLYLSPEVSVNETKDRIGPRDELELFRGQGDVNYLTKPSSAASCDNGFVNEAFEKRRNSYSAQNELGCESGKNEQNLLGNGQIVKQVGQDQKDESFSVARILYDTRM